MTFDYSTIKTPTPIRLEGLRGPSSLGQAGVALKPCDTPDSAFDPQELAMGILVEGEHTDDPETAKCIAKHHLVEEAQARGVKTKSRRIRYYRDLAKRELRWKKIAKVKAP